MKEKDSSKILIQFKVENLIPLKKMKLNLKLQQDFKQFDQDLKLNLIIFVNFYSSTKKMAFQDKKQNVRTEKWRQMMEKGIYKDKQLLRARIRKGIPLGIRSLAWPQIANLQTFIQIKSRKYTYSQLIKSVSNNIYEITLDIPRTFPEEQDSKYLKKSMNNVLKALSLVYPKIGYCQGMNFSVLRLLQILDDETAFWLLHQLYENDQSIMKNFVDPKSVDRQNYIFSVLFKQHLPKIFELFQSKSIAYQAYTIKWFMTLFSGGVSQELFYRIFEVFLNEKWSIIFAVGLALLKNKEKQISVKKQQEIFFLLSSEIYQVKDIDSFMNLAYSFEITPQRIIQIGNQFDRNGSMNQNSKLRHQKQIENREFSNKKLKQIIPQSQNIGVITFQNKAEEVNFQIFQTISKKKE